MKPKLLPHHTWENPPEWLKPNRDISHTSESNRKHYERSIKYYTKLLRATGPWTDHENIWAIYEEAEKRRKAGENVVVDHIVPITSDIVCGLQCSRNLQIITEKENTWKSNTYWPEGPMDCGIKDQMAFDLGE